MPSATAEQSLTKKQAAEVDRWVLEPFYWATQFLGKDFDPWSGQEELWTAYGKILNAKLKRYQVGPDALTPDETELADKMGISIMAGHGLGKERSMVGIMLHYMSVLKVYQPKGIVTAPAGPTLQSTLWPEFSKVIAGSEYMAALFEKNADRIYLKEDPHHGKFMRIEPRTIQQNSNPDEQGVVLAGIHALGVFYGVTEASGVPEPVFKPIEGGLSDPLSMILMIFNPTKRTGFAAESHTKNRKYWYCLQWDARKLKKEKLASPGRFGWFNERAQDALIEKYGEESDTVRIRVIGLPPKQSSDTLIHYDAAIAASEREIDILPSDPLCIGVDVGGGGSDGDPSMIAVLRGPKLTALYEFTVEESRLADQVADILSAELTNLSPDTQFAIGVDYIGLGRLVYNHLYEKHLIRNVYKVDVSESPLRDSEFHRMRDEVWWELREAFMETKEIVIDPKLKNYDALIAQLTSIKWASVFLASKAKIKVQGKGSSSGIPGVKPLLHSPNEADSLCIAWRMYKHYCSRVPMSTRRTLRARREQAVSWKVV
jgi:phage terminase large subunit